MSEKNVLGNFQINLPGPNGAALSISSYVIEGETPEGLSERMDTYREVLARQQRALEVPVLEEQIVQLERKLEEMRLAYVDLLEKQKRKTLPSAEQPHLKNYPIIIKNITDEIERGKAKIASVKAA
jgi:TolA-binding protein